MIIIAIKFRVASSNDSANRLEPAVQTSTKLPKLEKPSPKATKLNNARGFEYVFSAIVRQIALFTLCLSLFILLDLFDNRLLPMRCKILFAIGQENQECKFGFQLIAHSHKYQTTHQLQR
jgi:hypothetical protein